MVLILRSLHSEFDQIPSMNSLVTSLLQVPTLLKDENSVDVIETFQQW